ncbi:zinc transporter ZupT [Lentimicrobium sp.]|jgi:ZIP family zinc transporter|uniref:zinc transporter ZupT n=1 Tax=Lentimicrobium sp. TaxID=2034841 RepID=UPI0025E70789|nr:zinc transporter ZupT [Lentimicrobium sp.]MCO5258497.1 zinc transporter ZupT [Lentimicrobium sp.]MCO5261522.1 zinc transporter ZupT [Lentimicrobium sp.]HOP12875.1 zinc transporter ZupT [Lentimicrobium sp.]HPF63333.1 zinc transporter ZupT [Lentimicrobium sp.]HPJ62327.1 zinc transporter ZupT [Lentimicrobium sp.]
MSSDIPDSVILFAFGLTMFAGLSTGIGAAVAFFAKKTNTRLLSTALGFSAGVMIYVSMIEIFQKSKESLISELGEAQGYTAAVLAFFGGIFLSAIIDKLVPSGQNPHEQVSLSEISDVQNAVKRQKALYRMGIFSAIAIAIHNFPEGLATFFSAIEDPALGISVAIAVAIHNIPEGIAVSIPVFYSTENRKKAFFLSFMSGLAEPVGALFGFFFLLPFFNGLTFGITFGIVAGIMVFISLDELLPTAEQYGEHHLTIYGLIAGMAVMAVSLLLFV